MNASTPENDFESSEFMSAFLPLVLLGVSCALYWAFQLKIQFPERSDLMSDYIDLQKTVGQGELLAQQTEQSARNIQIMLNNPKLVSDLYAAAPNEVTSLLNKYGIPFNVATAPSTPATTGSEASTSAPAPAPAPSARPAAVP